MLNGEISFRRWQVETAAAIKDAHLEMFRFGAGGKENLNTVDYLKLANELRINHYPRFRRLVKQIINGELTQRQIMARVTRFYRGSKLSFETSYLSLKEKEGDLYTHRRLGRCKNHCLPCIEYFQLGVTKLSDMILPGYACDCRENCCCDYVTGKTKEEVLARL